MMNLRIVSISMLFIISLMISISMLHSQDEENYFGGKLELDTICYQYKFNPGDTLIYHVTAWDSISIDYGTPLLRSRHERYRIVCDSAIGGRYFLSQTMVHYAAKESNKDVDDADRSQSQWLGRKVWYEIDSVGRRYSFGIDDSLLATMSPGGAFNINLFFPFDAICKTVNESWSVSSLDELIENGIPLPLLRQTKLFRMLEPVDTLGYKCARLTYINTGQGSIELNKTGIARVNSVINGHGILDISIDHNFPVHLYATVEQKLTIIKENKVEIPGWHYITAYFTLEKYIPAKTDDLK